jgi:antitoxin MazE
MKVLVRKWGNSASVRIPVSVMESAHLRLDQPVDIREEDGRVIIEPIPAAQYDLDALVAEITDENRHEAVEMGPPVGREIW